MSLIHKARKAEDSNKTKRINRKVSDESEASSDWEKNSERSERKKTAKLLSPQKTKSDSESTSEEINYRVTKRKWKENIKSFKADKRAQSDESESEESESPFQTKKNVSQGKKRISKHYYAKRRQTNKSEGDESSSEEKTSSLPKEKKYVKISEVVKTQLNTSKASKSSESKNVRRDFLNSSTLKEKESYTSEDELVSKHKKNNMDQNKKRILKSQTAKRVLSDESDDKMSHSEQKKKTIGEKGKKKLSSKVENSPPDSSEGDESSGEKTFSVLKEKNVKISKAAETQFNISEDDNELASKQKKKYIENKKKILKSQTAKSVISDDKMSHSKQKTKAMGEKERKMYLKTSKAENSPSDSSEDNKLLSKKKKLIPKSAAQEVQSDVSESYVSTSKIEKKPTEDLKRKRFKKSYKEIPSGESSSENSDSSESSFIDAFKPKYEEKFTGKPLSCKSCNKKFETYARLLRHNRTHQLFPFKCVLCKSGFEICGKLMYHMKNHHPEVYPYPCEFPKCTKSYSTQKQKNDHEKCHWKYVCKFCKKGYVLKCDMQQHVEKVH